MKSKKDKNYLKKEDNDDIHNYAGKIEYLKRKLAKIQQGDTGIKFLEKLKLSGLSDGRICYYGNRLSLLLNIFNSNKIKLNKATKHQCEFVLSDILSRDYKGETKKAYALTLLKLVHFAKKDEIGDRQEKGYIKEISWIKPSRYLDKNHEEGSIKPEDLLTIDELNLLLSKCTNKRDKAMLWVMFEGALRPGELLHLKVGGIVFQENYLLLTTRGKTGSKRIALVLSFQPLLDWLEEHPLKDDPNAFLWYSYSPRSKTKRVSYRYLTFCVKKCAKEAGIKKRIWNYLIRHTQLTLLAKKLSDQTLRAYGNWKRSSKMPARYVHLSGKDIENAILELHGLKNEDENHMAVVKLISCLRCTKQNTPDNKRCLSCGFIIDQKLLSQVAASDETTLQNVVKRLEKLESIGDKVDHLLNEMLKQHGSNLL